MPIPFRQVDVFTDRPGLGNPVAVVLDAAALDDATMQRLAAWTNLSETTFVLPSTRADYRLRIFTPRGELPFAGHPTIGSAHAVIEAGIAAPTAGRLVQECEAGLIELRVAGDTITARVPPPRVVRDAPVDPTLVAAMLGAPVEASPVPLPIDVGPVWLIARTPSVAALEGATPDLPALEAWSREHHASGLTAFAIDPAPAGGPALHVRSFAPAAGITEDPVCGSGNAAVAAYLAVTGLLSRTGARYVAAQGAAVGRDGRVHVAVVGTDVTIGGQAVTVIEGTIRPA